MIWAYNAFWRLSESRPMISMVGPGRLPPSDIFAYCQLQGWAPEKQREFLIYCDVMDRKFMELADEEAKKQKQRQESEQRAKSAKSKR